MCSFGKYVKLSPLMFILHTIIRSHFLLYQRDIPYDINWRISPKSKYFFPHHQQRIWIQFDFYLFWQKRMCEKIRCRVNLHWSHFQKHQLSKRSDNRCRTWTKKKKHQLKNWNKRLCTSKVQLLFIENAIKILCFLIQNHQYIVCQC